MDFREMVDGNVVTIPANTLIHIAGFPFLLPTSAIAVGAPENLALALDVLRESEAAVQSCSDPQG